MPSADKESVRHRTPLLQGNNHDDDTVSLDTCSLAEFSTYTANRTSRRKYYKQQMQLGGNTRMLDRSAGYHQSRGEWRIHRKIPDKFHVYWFQDVFHTILNLPTWRIFAIMFVAYLCIVTGFALLYLLIAKVNMYVVEVPMNGSSDEASTGVNSVTKSYCGMDIDNFSEAMYFSLSTMTTIGYGISDYYFGDCWTPFAAVFMQVFTALTFNAVAIGVIFQRLSRGQNRATTVVFSDKAIIRRIKGKLYFMFQLCELRKHQLVEAHVRVYCVRHEREHKESNDVEMRKESSLSNDVEEEVEPDTCYFQTHAMRLQHPDDALGGFLLMALPNVVVHRLDKFSPLMPPAKWTDASGHIHSWNGSDCSRSSADFPALLKRECDEDEEKVIVGENQFAQQQEEITKFIKDRESELVVLIEGIDEITGSTIQCRHSYRYDDIVWNHTFAPCVLPKERKVQNNGSRTSVVDGCTLDLSRFHELIPSPLNSESSPLIANIG
mmetsp:Transcript_26639/g.41353  ORF Transcript_26639/g.41353 Transcript_26639/m.41353 type:complete len:493 (+) Transcript_26639:126-1604(+)|eukprot:CAMPEP_0196802034 /NCGR_PEP_ID=MMETSP1362-20130617/1762_1 /TAXON_ID=163516 /ORGANISM="Leptocylindrus danicus, Strain CCMP1856" /LENGTH=492 /DNA_ID=CAMNT_0042173241 /DNA_START=63 /DNA_END=1541 /DNA_ORIENTATION=+